MPRDETAAPHDVVDLPAGRKGRLVHADNAGQFRVEVTGADVVSRLAIEGALDRVHVEAAERLGQAIEDAAIRQRLCAAYQPHVDSGVGDFGLETLGYTEMCAWRRLQRLLGPAPAGARAVVVAAIFWEQEPSPSELHLLRLGLQRIAATLGIHRR